MIIYAIFLCTSAGCRPVPRPDQYSPETPPFYRTLSHCTKGLRLYGAAAHRGYLDANGRYVIADGIWYECLHRHVETWQGQ